MAAFEGIPFVDHHCHPWLRDWRSQDGLEFRLCFTESPYAAIARDHLPSSIPYRRALGQLAEMLDCSPTEDAILAERARLSEVQYLDALFAGQKIALLLLDDGYPPSAESLSRAEVSELSRIPNRRVIRLEALVERLTAECSSFFQVLDGYDAVAGDPASHDAVALKSIAAYRSDLRIEDVDPEQARGVWEGIREYQGGDGWRLTEKALVDFFVLRGLELASRQQIPVQFHCGYGDPDLDLREATPLHLRPVLEDAAFRDAPIVLLHGAYPFTAEAAYLAAVYPNVYLDISAVLPPLGLKELTRMISVALSVAPASKLLLSTDAARIPELHALGARAAREALSRALTGEGLSGEEMEEIGGRLLWKTARSIYGSCVPHM
jgi:hypothetical protein